MFDCRTVHTTFRNTQARWQTLVNEVLIKEYIYLNPNIFYSAAFVLVTCLVAHVTCRHGRTLRQGSLTNDEMRIVHGMMEAMEDDGDMANMEVLPAPVSRHPARGSSDRCKLGSKSYCPGEILFK